MFRIPLSGGREFDALTKARHDYCYTGRAGVCRYWKRRYNRRVRRTLSAETSQEVLDMLASRKEAIPREACLG
jgi:hypothetical protein